MPAIVRDVARTKTIKEQRNDEQLRDEILKEIRDLLKIQNAILAEAFETGEH